MRSCFCVVILQNRWHEFSNKEQKIYSNLLLYTIVDGFQRDRKKKKKKDQTFIDNNQFITPKNVTQYIERWWIKKCILFLFSFFLSIFLHEQMMIREKSILFFSSFFFLFSLSLSCFQSNVTTMEKKINNAVIPLVAVRMLAVRMVIIVTMALTR